MSITFEVTLTYEDLQEIENALKERIANINEQEDICTEDALALENYDEIYCKVKAIRLSQKIY